MNNSWFFCLFAVLLILSGWSCISDPAEAPAWPEVTAETRPWTRWWWHGSSVDTANLRLEMEAYQKAGLGGLELTPIFGVIGDEDHFIDYLSPEWMALFNFSLREAQRLGLGMDMATGTGWPFGGPWVIGEDASQNIVCQTYRLKQGERLETPVTHTQEPFVRAVNNQLYQLYGIYRNEGKHPAGSAKNPPEINPERRPEISDLTEPIAANKNLQSLALDQVRFEKKLPLLTLRAFSDQGKILDLTGKIDSSGRLNWQAPEGNWTLYALFRGNHGKMVERAAPGGEGYTIDHFSDQAIHRYLSRFDSAFSGYDIRYLRCFFNDSYEVDDAMGNADWTPRLFEAFRARRGYDLRDHLPALWAPDSLLRDDRILSDYRETLSDLILEKFTKNWTGWAHGKGVQTRNQSHGSPGNILDLYAASDIPETEGTDLLAVKFASSAAHVTGKKLASAEAATWLNEHFLSTLADIKKNLDLYFLGGINHVLYHGTAYSPREESWPGRLFYAAVHLNPGNPQWVDFAALNDYVTRVQSFLQDGKPGNDILLYFPAHDRFAERGPALIEHFELRGTGFDSSAFKLLGSILQNNGFAFDYISDKQINGLTCQDQSLITGGVAYKTIVVPRCKLMPLATFEKLINLAKSGATVIFHQQFPADISGWYELESRQRRYQALQAEIRLSDTGITGIRQAKTGKGTILLGENPVQLLVQAHIEREPLVDEGLRFTRRSHSAGYQYFILNQGHQEKDGWATLSAAGKSAFLFDPVSGQSGQAKTRISARGNLEIYLQLEAGQSIIIRTFQNNLKAAPFPYYQKTNEPVTLPGPWKVRFLRGGPTLPAEAELPVPGPWTNLSGEPYRTFSGTAAYSIRLPALPEAQAGWLLDLGKVAATASVWINGRKAGTVIGPVYKIWLEKERLSQSDTLEIRVSSLMANRIADLDKRGVFWKKFYNVNFPARLPENRKNGLFDASKWEPLESGLIGPVTLTPYGLKENFP